MPAKRNNIVITGASGAIGTALAEVFSGPGVTLGLIGRDRARLQVTQQKCTRAGADVILAALDVTDSDSLSTWLLKFDNEYPIDLVIANAGVTSTIGSDKESESWDDVRTIIDTNLYGVLGSVFPLVERMQSRGRGQIAMMSSLAAYVGMPISPVYSGSKAAVKVYGEALRGLLSPRGVGVTVICPGFVKSEMSDSYPVSKPFLMSADKAAIIIKKGIEKNRARVSFPFPLNIGVWFLSILPSSLNLAIQKYLRFY